MIATSAYSRSMVKWRNFGLLSSIRQISSLQSRSLELHIMPYSTATCSGTRHAGSPTAADSRTDSLAPVPRCLFPIGISQSYIRRRSKDRSLVSCSNPLLISSMFLTCELDLLMGIDSGLTYSRSSSYSRFFIPPSISPICWQLLILVFPMLSPNLMVSLKCTSSSFNPSRFSSSSTWLRNNCNAPLLQVHFYAFHLRSHSLFSDLLESIQELSIFLVELLFVGLTAEVPDQVLNLLVLRALQDVHELPLGRDQVPHDFSLLLAHRVPDIQVVLEEHQVVQSLRVLVYAHIPALQTVSQLDMLHELLGLHLHRFPIFVDLIIHILRYLFHPVRDVLLQRLVECGVRVLCQLILEVLEVQVYVLSVRAALLRNVLIENPLRLAVPFQANHLRNY